MDKHYLAPLELLNLANQHAYSADYLLKNNEELNVRGLGNVDTFFSCISLMYLAYELNLKAYLLQADNKNNQYKNLLELLELATDLNIANDDILLLKKLSKAYAFRKGIDYELFEDRDHLHVFCVEIIRLYTRFQELLPLELHPDYQ